MTLRDVRVRLSVENRQAIAGLKQTGAAAEQVAGQMTRAGSSSQKHWDTIGKYSGRAFLVGAAGLGIMEKANYSFDKSMSNVDAATHARVQTLEQLRSAAIKAGADSVFSASEAADAETELAKAGVKTKAIIGGGLTGALNLASAGQLGVADSAEIMATALTQFQLPGSKAVHVADLLAAGAGKAQGEVSDMALALNYAGVPASQLGVSIEQTAGTIALLAKNGILGEKAGTGLRGILSSLTSPSQAASKEMKRLGIEVFDAKGNFIGLDGLAGQLHRRLSGLTQAERSNALGRIFGNAQLTAANVLYREGAKGVHTWTKNVNDSGYAADTAKRKLNNLAGDVEYLKGDLEALFIKRGGGAQDGLRDLVQGVDHLVTGFSELPEHVQSSIVKVIALGTATAGALYVVSKMAKGYREIRSLFPTKGLTKAATGGVLGAATKGVVPVYVTNAGFGAAGGLAGSAGRGAAAAEGAAAGAAAGAAKKGKGAYALDALAGAIAYSFAQSVTDQLAKVGDRGNESGSLSQFSKGRNPGVAAIFGGKSHTLENDVNSALGAKRFGGVFSKLDTTLAKPFGGDNLSKSLDNIKELDKTLAHMYATDPAKAQTEYDNALKKSGVSAEKFASILPKATHEMQAATGSSKWFDDVTSGLKKAVVQGSLYEKRIKTIPKELRLFVSTPGAVKSIADMGSLARAYKLTPRQIRTIMQLQGFSDAEGRAASVGKAFYRLPKQVRTRVLADTVKSRFDVANLQRQYHLTPAQVRTLFKATGVDNVRQAAAAAKAALANIPKTVFVDIRGRNHVSYGGASQNGLKVPSADGSTVPKTGRGYADRHPYLLADGEEVTSNRHGQADRYRPVLKAINADLPRWAIKAMLADGGTAGATAFSGGTGTKSVTVTFPAPAVYAAAVKAADDIAAAAIKTTATAKDLRAVHLDDLHQQQQIRDLQKSLNEHEKKTVGKGKAKHTVKGKLTLRGLDRTTAEAELADAKATLVEMRKQSAVAKQLADAQAEARQALQDARKESTDTLSGGDILARGLSPTSVISQVDRLTSDVAQYGSVVARLRAANASPALLSRMKGLADQLDFRSAIRLGQALLDQPALLGQLNASLSAYTNASSNVATLTTDPRFLGTGAWNPVSQSLQTIQANVNLMADPSTWTADIMRQMQHYVDTQIANAVKGA